jgi:hypothetical protein
MTKKSLDNSAARSGSGSVTKHPAFPAIVALWFTVLLGLGGLLLPVVLLERAVELSRIASLAPAAAPPLGLTAKLVVAISLGVLGAVLGFTIARRVSGAGSRRETDIRSAATFSVAGDFGVEEARGEYEPAAQPIRRRRALAITDLGPATEGISPDADPQHDTVSGYIPVPEPGFQEWRSTEGTLEQPGTSEVLAIEAESEPIELPHAIEPLAEFVEPEPAGAEDWQVAERLIEAEFVPAPNPAPPRGPLDDLDIKQLVERFADTVQRRREWLAAGQPGPSFQVPSALTSEAPAPQMEVAPPPLEEQPVVERPPFFDWLTHLNVEAMDKSKGPGFSIPMHTAAFETPSFRHVEDQPDPENDAETETDDAYGSLIEMKNPFAPPRSDFIRIDEEGAEREAELTAADEVEATSERRETVDAEASLRAALAKLQQLSGNP